MTVYLLTGSMGRVTGEVLKYCLVGERNEGDERMEGISKSDYAAFGTTGVCWGYCSYGKQRGCEKERNVILVRVPYSKDRDESKEMTSR